MMKKCALSISKPVSHGGWLGCATCSAAALGDGRSPCPATARRVSMRSEQRRTGGRHVPPPGPAALAPMEDDLIDSDGGHWGRGLLTTRPWRTSIAKILSHAGGPTLRPARTDSGWLGPVHRRVIAGLSTSCCCPRVTVPRASNGDCCLCPRRNMIPQQGVSRLRKVHISEPGCSKFRRI